MTQHTPVSSPLYHGTRRSLPDGTRLTPRRPVGEPEERAVEEILEQFRPAHCLPRAASVFMVDDPDLDHLEKVGGYGDYVFLVQPDGVVERNDVHWWGRILSEGALDYAAGDKAALRDLRPLAEAYWRGAPSDAPRWEFRARSTTVVECVGGYSVAASSARPRY